MLWAMHIVFRITEASSYTHERDLSKSDRDQALALREKFFKKISKSRLQDIQHIKEPKHETSHVLPTTCMA
jgi:hypothetical protein